MRTLGSFPVAIDGLSKVESRKMLEWFHDMITYGHDLQVRFKWMDENDIGTPLTAHGSPLSSKAIQC